MGCIDTGVRFLSGGMMFFWSKGAVAKARDGGFCFQATKKIVPKKKFIKKQNMAEQTKGKITTNQ